jgi:23S rRNA (uracil1939-C5)-methyltransferase
MEVKLDKLVPGGQALGVLEDGKKVFVWGGLPGELVEVDVTKSKKSYAEAVTRTVLEASPHRVPARDDCYLSTSPWQVMDYDYELEQKALLINEAFKQQGVSQLAVVDPEVIAQNGEHLATSPVTTGARSVPREQQLETAGQEYFYRNKMEYSLWWSNEKNQIELAFHKRGSHQKAPFQTSSIERPEILAEARRIVDELNAQQAEARTYQSLMIRCNQAGEVSGGLFVNGQPHPRMKPLTDTILGRAYSYLPNGFFQINLPVYELALTEIKKHLSPNRPIVDMYAGVGTIGLSVADDGQPVTLVETNPDAFSELENNCRGLTYVKPIQADAKNALKYITYDINLIVDPPRAGLDEAVTARILTALPEKVIYLSCNPITQARDIAKLLPKYRLTNCQGYNFFPRTPHIENLVVLERLP